ncbi:MAG: GNAT family N-acetyltransferase [Spirochaetaceae bacterium]
MSWNIATSKNLYDIIIFLKYNEWQHVQAISLFINNNQSVFPNNKNVLSLIKKEQNRITGIVIITSKGLLYPVFNKEIINNQIDKEELIKLVSSIKVKIHAIIGIKEDIDFFDKIIFKRLRGINKYLIMHRENTDLLTLDNSIDYIKATNKDYNKLLPLEFEYQIEEVLLNAIDLNKKATGINFKNKIATDDIYYSTFNNLPITKAGTSYKSLNYTLIGGVFTWKEFRNRGFSTNVLKFLLNDQLSKNLKASLFVKSDNSSAIHVYKKLDFINPTEYQINYYYI